MSLRLKFYRIVAVRYKTPMGEIDLVAVRGNVVIAVEVKARKSYDEALTSITPPQQARIGRALQHFVMSHPQFAHADLRFDVMAVLPRRWPVHIVNAWRVD